MRRRRGELARLGVVFVEAGRGSHYVASEPVFEAAVDALDPATTAPFTPANRAITAADPAIPMRVSRRSGEDGRLRFVLDELRLQDGRTIREAAKRDQWIVADVLAPIFRTDWEGLPAHRLVYTELARGHGKSLYAAACALAEAYLIEGTEIIVAAADIEQASIILDHLDGFTERSPVLRAHVSRGANVRVLPGSRIRVISSDSASAWGLGGVYPRFRLICDELVAWREGRGQELWEALFSATGKVPDAQTLVLSNAGWNADRSWQHRIREIAAAEPFGHLYAPEGMVASWISPRWIEEQRKVLPPSAFERVVMNRWTSQDGDFVSSQQLDGCIDGTLTRVATGTGKFFGGIDLGLTKDRTALSIVRVRDGRVELCDLQVFQGTRKEPVSIEKVERSIIDASERYRGLRLYADRWQFENSLQRLGRQGVNITRFEFTASSVQRLSESLYRAITSRTLALPPGETELRRELLGLVTKETPTGWRFDHRSGGFSDRAMALAMSVMLAEKAGKSSPMRVYVPRGNITDRLGGSVTEAVVDMVRRAGRSVTPPTRQPVAHAPSGRQALNAKRRLRARVFDPLAASKHRYAAQHGRGNGRPTLEQIAPQGVYDGTRAALEAQLPRLDPYQPSGGYVNDDNYEGAKFWLR